MNCIYYVLVGGGTAGCALARRLAEDLQLTVLLLEAGDEETRSEIINMPLTAKEVQKTQVDWSFMTTPQAACCQGFINKVCDFLMVNICCTTLSLALS